MSSIVDPVTGEAFPFHNRTQLNLRPPKAVYRCNASQGQFGHHAVTGTHNPFSIWRGIQNLHMDRNGWNDIAYTVGVSDDGHILEGRGLWVAGGHTAGYNSTSHAVCYIGNAQDKRPSPIALKAYRAWLRYVQKVTANGRIRGHRDVAATACPGDHIYNWLRNGMPVNGEAVVPPPRPGPVPTSPVDISGLPVPRFKHYKDGQVLRNGSRGKAVAEIQFLHNLIWLGSDNWVHVDGFYGPKTTEAIRGDQALWNLLGGAKVSVDGIFGRETAIVYTFILSERVAKGTIHPSFWS